jgi:hypothetical protein
MVEYGLLHFAEGESIRNLKSVIANRMSNHSHWLQKGLSAFIRQYKIIKIEGEKQGKISNRQTRDYNRLIFPVAFRFLFP